MPIYREPSIFYREVPSWQWKNPDIRQRMTIETCLQGASVLRLIMLDLKLELKRCANIQAGTVDDATNLITLVGYFLFGPLCNILSAMNESRKSQHSIDLKNEYNDAVWTLYCSVVFAQYELDKHSATPRVMDEVYRLNLSQSSFDHATFKLPCLSPIELLLRVVTARQSWDSLGMDP
ncbi:uncharacterized protein BKA55DRAFT_686332 [Fusarium redolens]|uniref:Uncharacterized protein n=1 Tax=Fusarium redolens TaxID=48865 RepID=A0A9P9HP31_FUSRE|nr:uncharacterized protein BKA55DRAFT_686332 [Fusarium redolens]KAH7260751.1 hypothetical protein BKA55DRAFT_686332 [Fusarium redolens]